MSKQATLLGTAMALSIVASPVLAKVGVDENAATPEARTSAAPSGDGGSSAGSGWDEKEGGFHIGSGDYKLVVGGRLQPGFDYISWDDDSDIEDTVTFRVRRARLNFLGNFMGKDNTFYVQIAADSPDPAYTTDTSGRDFELLDAWVKHSFGSSFYLKGGQFKTPWGRQNLTSSGKLQFPRRALGSDVFSISGDDGGFGFDIRDNGLEIGGGMSEDKVQWALALTNGSARNALNLDDRVAIFGRLSVSPMGNYGYSEGDLDNSDTMATTFGLAVSYEKDSIATEWTRVNLDGGLKYRGWGVQGELFWVRAQPDGPDVDDEKHKSFYLQGGYFVDPKRIEIAARWSRIIFDGPENDINELSAGLNWYMMGHRLKWQTALTAVKVDGLDFKHYGLTTQAQIWF